MVSKDNYKFTEKFSFQEYNLKPQRCTKDVIVKGWLAIAKLKPLSLFISLLLMLKKPFGNVKIEK